MARFGQGVNAQLGAISYDDYLRGAMSGSQMTAQGNAAIGQGIGAGLQGIEKGIEKRAEYKTQVSTALKTADLIEKSAGIPEAVKSFAREAKTSFNDPNISLADQAAMASRMNGMFGGVMQAGLTTAMKDPNTKALEDLQLATGRQALDQKKAQIDGWALAVKASTKDGKLDLNTLATNAFNNGVTDIGELSRLMQTVGAVNFKPSLVQITGEDGKIYTAMTTGFGTAAQVREPTPTRAVRPTPMEERERVSKLLAEAVKNQDWSSVAMYSTALQTPGMFGGNASASDVQRSFAAPSQSSTTPPPSGGIGIDTSAAQTVPKLTGTPAAPAPSANQEINDAKAWLSRNPGANPDKIAFIKKKYGL